MTRGTSMLLAMVATLLCAAPAAARRNGIQAYGCWGCHQGQPEASVTLAPDRELILPGDLVNFTATITNPGVAVGGIYVVEPETGALGAVAGSGLTLSSGALTHTSPKAAVNGSVTFDFTWQAPAGPGAALVGAYALAANGNKTNSGDFPAEGYTQFVFGCEAKTFYWDGDADGHGVAESDYDPVLGCADQPPPAGYSAVTDDCDDAQKLVYPGAPERCNDKDDDCDELIDEDTTPETLWPDADGDGFYASQTGESVIGCLPLDGYADEPGDCGAVEPARFPGAKEVCNLLDDNCDGRVDEYVRPRCGVGRCEVEGPTCDPADCVPYAARPETCNGLDDDCDGVVDDDDPCGADKVCLGIHCVVVEGAAETGGTAGSGSDAPRSGGSGQAAQGGAGGTGGAGQAAQGGAGGAGGTGQAPKPVELRPGKSASCVLAPDDRVNGSGVAFGLALLVGSLRRLRARKRRRELGRRTLGIRK